MLCAMYTSFAKQLHWLIAGAIVLQYVLAELAEEAADADLAMQQLGLLANHKSVGITILGLAVVRLVWRLAHRPPALPENMAEWQVIASKISHGTLYVLLFFLPITGWLMSSATAYSVSWFNLVTLPDLVAPDESLKDTLVQLHHFGAEALFVIAVIHLGAALKHAVIDRDGVLARMSSIGSIAAFLIVIGTGYVMLAAQSESSSPASSESSAPSSASATATRSDTPTSTLPAWNVDYARSVIRFTGEQAGAPFEGEWPQWEADIRFDVERLDESTAVVHITTSQVDTQDAERDSTLLGAEWFDAERFPVAIYRASSFAVTDSGSFTAEGEFTVKASSLPLKFEFTVARNDSDIHLEGTATIDRLVHKIGVGEWLDPSWVGQFVDVQVTVIARADDSG